MKCITCTLSMWKRIKETRPQNHTNTNKKQNSRKEKSIKKSTMGVRQRDDAPVFHKIFANCYIYIYIIFFHLHRTNESDWIESNRAQEWRKNKNQRLENENPFFFYFVSFGRFATYVGHTYVHESMCAAK